MRAAYASPADILARAARFWRPVERVKPSAWVEANVRLPRGLSPMPGPVSFAFMPYLRGIIDDWTDPEVREISVMAGTRLGKTTLLSLLNAYTASVDPGPSIIASATEPDVRELSKDKLQRIVLESPALSPMLPPAHEILMTRLQLGPQTIYFAWSGSVTSLGARGARYCFATEIDKWSTEKSAEADPLALVEERVKDYPNHRVYRECSPTVKGSSRIEAAYGRSDRRRYHVPCPHCGVWAPLIWGTKGQPGGVKWPHGEDGHSVDPEAARKGAFYECPSCRGVITDMHKPGMLRKGAWVPQGCSVRPFEAADGAARPAPAEGKPLVTLEAYDGTPLVMEGTPEHPNARHHGYHLSSIYSPLLTFGDCAAKWLQAKGDFRLEQNFFNSWLAEAWSMAPVALAWREIYDRTHDDRPAGVIPATAAMVALSADVMKEWCYLCVRAWDDNGASWLVVEEQLASLAELERVIRAGSWPIAGTTDVRGVTCSVIDARYRQAEVDELVQSIGPSCRAIMGGNLKHGTYKPEAQTVSPITGKPFRSGYVRWTIASEYYWDKLVSMMHRAPGYPHRWHVHAEAREPYLRGLISMARLKSKDVRGKEIWKFKVLDDALWVEPFDVESYQVAAWEMWKSGTWVFREHVAPRRPAPPQDSGPRRRDRGPESSFGTSRGDRATEI